MINFVTYFAAACDPNKTFFGLPAWYKYLSPDADALGNCAFKLQNINDIWLIAAALIEMLLRLGALVAVGFIIFGGVKYISSQGEPDRTKNALGTIINALVGLVISLIAAQVVSFIAGKF